MSEWKWTQTTHKARPAVYRIVKGTPLDVEIETNQLIEDGFLLNGPLMEYVLPGTSNKIFVQAMVKYEEPK